ncbi:MAG: N-acetyltransferase [Chloroflexota bacterium]|nr:N-acetyltransferase [Chloroflexota bacterium]
MEVHIEADAQGGSSWPGAATAPNVSRREAILRAWRDGGVRLGEAVVIHHPEHVNLYGCTIGANCKIASFVEIQRDVIIGRNVKVEAFAFIPTGVTIADGAFIGPHVCFTNDRYPAAVNENGELLTGTDWAVTPTVVERGASIGANATIVCGVVIGEGALVGAGAVVTRDVPPHSLVVGNPARVVGVRPGRPLL